jgi:hypothetical protein
MKTPSLSTKIYIGLIITLAALAASIVFLPQGQLVTLFAEQELPASKSVLALVTAAGMLVLYGGLGFLGLRLSQRIGFADVWDSAVSNKQRFVTPGAAGLILGVFFFLADALFSQFHGFGPLPHPPFPTSLVASAVAGIGEEVIFRLFFVSFWVWLISHVILKGRLQNQVFGVVVVFSALAFALAHLPAGMLVLGISNVAEVPVALMSEVLLLNGVLSVLAAIYLRRSGFLACVGVHFWTDVVWHVVSGAL